MTSAETRTCPQCERDFAPNARHQIYDFQECRYQGHIQREVEAAQAGVQRVETHPLDEVRDQRAAKKHNRDLGGLIRKAIVNQIQIAGECAPEDLISLYPEGEVDECRRLATAQFGAMASNGDGTAPLIREKERRKSSIPSRKGAKVSVWEFTKAGWDKWGTAGVGAGGTLATIGEVANPSQRADKSRVDPGGTPAPPDTSQQPGSPETHIGARSPVSGEPARLFEDATPSAYDPWEDAA